MEHQELRELTGAYALGVLPEDEPRELEAHLAFCQTCAREVRELCEVAATLATLEERQPPPHVRARLLAETGGESRAADARPSALRGWLLAAASVALVLVAGYAAVLRGRVATLEAALEQSRQTRAAAEYQVASLRGEVSAAERVTDILAASDLARVELTGQAPAPAAGGRAYWSRSRGLIFTATNLPPLPPSRVYQLWMVTAQQKISAGLLSIDRFGRATAVAQTPADVQPVAIAVTIEPAGGVESPTGPIYLVGTL